MSAPGTAVSLSRIRELMNEDILDLIEVDDQAVLVDLAVAVKDWVATEPESVKYPGMADESALNAMLDLLARIDFDG